MCTKRTVDSLLTITVKKICDDIQEYIAKSPDLVEHLPGSLKSLILQKITRSSFRLRESDPKDIFPLLLHRNLQKIDLSSISIDDALLELFDICTELKDVSLLGNKSDYPSTKGLCRFMGNKKKLRMLRLENLITTTDDVIAAVVDNCPNLSGLALRGCKSVTDVSMNLLSTLNNLIFLDFSGTMITNEGITALSNGNSKDKILELRIAYCPKITYHILSKVIEDFTKMEIFQFNDCAQSNDQRELEALEATKMTHLKQITFTVSW